jgi:hypothetical protein
MRAATSTVAKKYPVYFGSFGFSKYYNMSPNSTGTANSQALFIKV